MKLLLLLERSVHESRFSLNKKTYQSSESRLDPKQNSDEYFFLGHSILRLRNWLILFQKPVMCDFLSEGFSPYCRPPSCCRNEGHVEVISALSADSQVPRGHSRALVTMTTVGYPRTPSRGVGWGIFSYCSFEFKGLEAKIL